jgi:hypothetical protein
MHEDGVKQGGEWQQKTTRNDMGDASRRQSRQTLLILCVSFVVVKSVYRLYGRCIGP